MMKWWWLIVIVVAAGWLAPNQTVSAEDLHYSVAAKLPANQRAGGASYFDLDVTPGATQQLQVAVANRDDRNHRFRLQVNRANTNTNGVVDYTHHGVTPAPSLQADIEQMVKQTVTISVPAGTTKVANLRLTVPTQPFSGIALGGIRVVEIDDQKAARASGVQLTNQFAYVLGLAVRESAQEVAPHLVLHQVVAKQVNYRNAVSVRLENTAPAMLRDLALKAKLYRQGEDDPVVALTKSQLKVAPNSRFDFPITTNNLPIQPGRYTLKLTAVATSGRWTFTKAFTISRQKAKALNRTAVDQTKDPALWPKLALGSLVGLIVVGLVVLAGLIWRTRKH